MNKLQEYIKQREEELEKIWWFSFDIKSEQGVRLSSFHSQSLNGLLEIMIEIIAEKKQLPAEVPHHNPYLSGYNHCIEDIIDMLKKVSD